MAKIKTYELTGFNACKTSTTYMGVKVNLNFEGGNTLQGKSARIVTDNPFAQDAIENDTRFKFGTIRLVSVVDNDVNEDKEQKVNKSAEALIIEDVTNINELDAWFAEKGVTLASSKKSYINELCKEHNVQFPNLKLK